MKVLPVKWDGNRLAYQDKRINGDGTVLYDRKGTPEEKARIEKALGVIELEVDDESREKVHRKT
jgi:hypothetical protein